MTMSVTSPVFLQLLPSWCTAAFPPAGLLYDNVASRQVAAARQFGSNRRQTGLADDGLVSSKLTPSRHCVCIAVYKGNVEFESA
jgi:hypothetical protein